MRASRSLSGVLAAPVCAAATLLLFGLAGHTSARPSQWVVASLMSALEQRFARADLAPGDRVAGIIALGGDPARVHEAIRLSRLFPAARLVVTGASVQDNELARTQAGSGQRLVIEPDASNTYENALFTKRMIQPMPGERWLVVTSAAHMPRAIGSFRGVGFAVEAWPIRNALSSHQQMAGVIGHEWLGLLAYRLAGRTPTLFPAPLDWRPEAGPSDTPALLTGRADRAVRSPSG